MKYNFKKLEVELLDTAENPAKKIVAKDNRGIALLTVVVVDRKQIGRIKNQQVIEDTHSLYLLIDANDRIVYIGEAEGFKKRYWGTHIKRDDWSQAIVMTGHKYTKSHVVYLEKITYDKVIKEKLSENLQNKASPKSPLNFEQTGVCQDDLDTLKVILWIININSFEPVASDPKSITPAPSTFLDAAETVLSQAGRSLHVAEITQKALKMGLKTSGKTPVASMNSALLVDIKKSKNKSKFVKLAPSVYGLYNSIVRGRTGNRDQKTSTGSNTIKTVNQERLRGYWYIHFKVEGKKHTATLVSSDGRRFTVVAGSLVRAKVRKSYQLRNAKPARARKTWLANHSVTINDDLRRINENYQCPSASSAAEFVLGLSVNVWLKVVNEQGQTMDQVARFDKT